MSFFCHVLTVTQGHQTLGLAAQTMCPSLNSAALLQVGEVVDERYEVFAAFGKGVFSSVLRARDRLEIDPATGRARDVAIKVIRANDTMCALITLGD